MMRQHTTESCEVLAGFIDPYTSRLLRAIAGLAIVVMAVPVIYMVVWSIWGTEVVGILRPWGQGSLAWIRDLLVTPEWQKAISYSSVLGVLASLTGAIINLLNNYAKRFAVTQLQQLTHLVMLCLLLNPLLAYGVAIRSTGSLMHMNPWLVLYLGHLIVVLPIQYFVFEAASEKVCDDTLWAARTCGASHFGTILFVFVPSLWNAFVGAVALGFFISFDELVIALFVLDVGVGTVPLRLWKDLLQVVTPEAAVVATLLLGIAGVFLVIRGVGTGRMRTVSLSMGEVLREKLPDLLAGALATPVLLWIFPALGRWGGAGDTVVCLCMTFMVSTAIAVTRARRPVAQLLAISNYSKRGFGIVPQQFAFTSVDRDIEITEGLKKGHWVSLEREALSRLVQLCFQECSGAYVGTDRNVPSRFCELYPDYLDTQLSKRQSNGDVRVLFLEKTSLQDDQDRNPSVVSAFLRDHVAAHVILLRASESSGLEEAKARNLPSPEFGVFGWRYVLFFRRPQEDSHTGASVMLLSLTPALKRQLDGFWAHISLEETLSRDAHGRLRFETLDNEGRDALRELILAPPV